MNSLKFSTGVKTFSVNDGAAEISYNPTDVNFVSNLYDFIVSCAEKYEADKDKKFTDNTAFFEYAKQRDADVCAGIDNLFRRSVPGNQHLCNGGGTAPVDQFSPRGNRYGSGGNVETG